MNEPQDKRGLILDSAIQVFARFGFAKATLDDIADAVGMKKGSLYYYYESKEAIFSAVINRLAREILAKMQREIETIVPAREALLKFVETGLRRSNEATSILGVTAGLKLELLPLADRMMTEFHNEVMDYLAGIIQRGVGSGEFRACDARRVAWAIHEITQGMHLSSVQTVHMRAQDSLKIDPIIEEIQFAVGLVLDGLRPEAA